MDDAATVERLQKELAAARERAALVEQRLQTALAVGRMEYWEWDPATDVVTRYRSLLGDDLPSIVATRHAGKDSFVIVHPDDRERHQAMVQAASRAGQGWHTELRVIAPGTGEVRWMEESASRSTDPVSGKLWIIGCI